MSERVQLWKCDRCEWESAYGGDEPPDENSRCLTRLDGSPCGGRIRKSRVYRYPPKPPGARFFHWGRREWVVEQ